MNVIGYERGLLWTWSVMNVVGYERGVLWTWCVMNVVCYERDRLSKVTLYFILSWLALGPWATQPSLQLVNNKLHGEVHLSVRHKPQYFFEVFQQLVDRWRLLNNCTLSQNNHTNVQLRALTKSRLQKKQGCRLSRSLEPTLDRRRLQRTSTRRTCAWGQAISAFSQTLFYVKEGQTRFLRNSLAANVTLSLVPSFSSRVQGCH